MDKIKTHANASVLSTGWALGLAQWYTGDYTLLDPTEVGNEPDLLLQVMRELLIPIVDRIKADGAGPDGKEMPREQLQDELLTKAVGYMILANKT